MLDEERKITERQQIPMRKETLREYFTTVEGEDQVKAVMEASYGWDFLCDLLSEILEEVKLAHPLKTKFVAEARIKNNTLDFLHLAQLLRADFIPEAYAPEKEIRSRRAVVRAHCVLTMVKMKLKNHIHALLDRNHLEDEAFPGGGTNSVETPGCSCGAFPFQAMIPCSFPPSLTSWKRWRTTSRNWNGNSTSPSRMMPSFPFSIPFPASGGSLPCFCGMSWETSSGSPPQEIPRLCGNCPLPLLLRETDSQWEDHQSRKSPGPLDPPGGAAQSTIHKCPYLARYYHNVALREEGQSAKAAVARKLLTYVYWVRKERRPYLPEKGNQSRAVVLHSS